jgi:hypothetical protein
MDVAYLSAMAALVGSVVGGLPPMARPGCREVTAQRLKRTPRSASQRRHWAQESIVHRRPSHLVSR